MTETTVAVLGGYLVGVTTLLTVEWIRDRRHQRKMRRVTKAWIDHNGYAEIRHLVRDVGIYTNDPDLLFKATLIHLVYQLHPTKAKSVSGLALTPALIEQLEELRPRLFKRKNKNRMI